MREFRTDITPVDKFCDMMFGYRPMIDRHPDFSKKKGLTYPFVPFDLGAGEPLGRIALFPDMAPGCTDIRKAFVEYEIPIRLFKRFTAIAGLNRRCKNMAKGIFEVELDGKTVYCSNVLSENDQGEFVEIALKGASRIRLSVRDSGNAPCPTAFFYPVWAIPTLWKN